MFGMGGAIQPIEDSFWEPCLKIITNLHEAQEKVVDCLYEMLLN